MASNVDREYSVKAGKLPLGSERFNYDGDFNAKPVKQNRILNHAAAVDNQIDALRLAGDMSAEDEKNLLLRRLDALNQSESKIITDRDESTIFSSASTVSIDTQMG